MTWSFFLGVHCCVECMVYFGAADCPLAKSLPRDVMGFGFSSGVVFTPPISPKAPASWLPRSGNIKLHARAFGYEADLLEV